MHLIDIIRKIRRSFYGYMPSVEILISRTDLLHNLSEYRRKYPKLFFAPVLKSNAYGHGLVEVARILDKETRAFFVVDSLYEAMILRNKNIVSPLLVIGYASANNISNCKLPDIAFTITSLEHLKSIAEIIRTRVSIHLKIDTGMHRQGILLNQVNETIDIIRSCKYLNLEGVCSHLADADNIDQSFTQLQIDHWNKVIALLNSNFNTVKFTHILATSGLSYHTGAFGNTARLGIGLYGIDPLAPKDMNLRPVLQMRSIVSSIKTILTGECIGYNAIYKTDCEMKVATIPVGYFEGIDRRLSNHGVVKINGIFCPIVGNVSMNIASISVSSVQNIKLDDEVVIISSNTDDPNSVQNTARLINTIPYEILVHIPQHLRRTVI